MTQEELDALMAGGDLDAMDEMSEQSQEVSIPSEADEVALEEMSGEVTFEEEKTVPKEVHEYRASATMSWPPPPPTDDHKMVHQLEQNKLMSYIAHLHQIFVRHCIQRNNL